MYAASLSLSKRAQLAPVVICKRKPATAPLQNCVQSKSQRKPMRRKPMIIATLTEIPGREHKVLGLVKGSVVQSKHIGRDIMAGLKTIVGGEIKGYTEMLSEARNVATDRMIEEAKKLGADAIIGVRFESSSIKQNAAELLAYGTAVKF
jgi:uncharacterized protein YbjQ (UPF0145 family)